MWECGQDWNDSDYCTFVSFCEHGDDPSSSIKAENLLKNRVTELFMQYSYHGVSQLIRCSLLLKRNVIGCVTIILIGKEKKN